MTPPDRQMPVFDVEDPRYVHDVETPETSPQPLLSFYHDFTL